MSVWKPKSINVYQRKVEEINEGINVPHELLDKLPKKTVAQQVEDLILYGQQLEEAKLALYNLPLDESKDIDESDTGIDEYSGLHELYDAAEDLQAKVDKVQQAQNQAVAPSTSSQGVTTPTDAEKAPLVNPSANSSDSTTEA